MSWWKWRKRRQQELEEELSIHMDMAIADRIQRGETPAEAEAAALREFGNRLLVSESVRRAWGWTRIESFAQDLRYGCRLLRTARGFTALAILALSLGIGAATVMFGVLDGVLLDPFPYPHGDRLVALSIFDLDQSEEAGRRWTLSPEERRTFEQSASLFEGFVACDTRNALLEEGDTPHCPAQTLRHE
ncbi:MAG TPA: permease prefix domain 1-containing protein [Bryobacteraceae bacterium]